MQERTLLDLVEKTGTYQTGDFLLSSGRMRSYYFDCNKLMFDYEAAPIISRIFFDDLYYYTSIRSVIGVANGATPLIASLITLASPSIALKGGVVRMQGKTHGITDKRIGTPIKSPVAIFDDVVTTGQSIIDVIKYIEDEGYEIGRVYSIFATKSGVNRVKESGYHLTSIYTIDDDGRLTATGVLSSNRSNEN